MRRHFGRERFLTIDLFREQLRLENPFAFEWSFPSSALLLLVIVITITIAFTIVVPPALILYNTTVASQGKHLARLVAADERKLPIPGRIDGHFQGEVAVNVLLRVELAQERVPVAGSGPGNVAGRTVELGAGFGAGVAVLGGFGGGD